MKCWKLLIVVLLLVALPLAAVADSAAKVYYFKDTPFLWHVSPHFMREYWSMFIPGEFVFVFRLTEHDEAGNPVGHFPAYCADLITNARVGAVYERVNLEDSGYFSKDNAEHVRSILNAGYWPDSGSVLALAKAAGLAHPEKLTNAEAMTATQSAIWHYTNPDQRPIDPYVRTYPQALQFYYTDDPDNTDKMLVYDTESVNWKEPDLAMDCVEVPEIDERITKVFNYLIGLEGTPAGEVIWDFSGEHVILSRVWQRDDADGGNTRPSLPSSYGAFWDALFELIFGDGWKEPTPGEEGEYYYQVLCRFKLKGTEDGLKNLTLTAQLWDSDDENATLLDSGVFDLTKASDVRKLHLDSEGYYTVAFSYPLDAAEFTAEPHVTLRLTGTQDIDRDVYLYMPAEEDGGRHNSQSMVGFAAGRTKVDVVSDVAVTGASLTVRGQKYMDGQPCATPYTFELVDVTDPAAPIHCGYTRSNRHGDFVFSSVHYQKPGVYRYEVREAMPEGVFGLDDTVYTIEVIVEEDEGSLVARDYTILSPANADSIVFDNCGTTDISVRKVWNRRAGVEVPGSVEVALIKNGETFETIRLSDSNGWHYTWRNLDTEGAQWAVEELTTLEDYETDVSLTGTTFTVTNTAKRTVPQTGDGALPAVWLLAGCLSLIALTAALRRKAR